MEDRYEYFETTEVKGERDVDMITPPVPDGTGWELSERLVIDRLVVFRWRRVSQQTKDIRRAALQ